jgi:DNA-binding FadR family transcriptional regulator
MTRLVWWALFWHRMPENGQVTEPVGRPVYQQVADDLRRKIAAAELPVGSAIPSTAQLCEMYGVSTTVVRAAVAKLREQGLVVGRAGKGVFVSSTPDSFAERAASATDLARQLGELRAELNQVKSAQQDEASGLATLREQVGVLQAQIADLYARLGWPYPEVSPPPDADEGSGQAGERSSASS